MTTLHRPRRAALALAAAALLLLPALAGCSLIPNLPGNLPGNTGDNGAATSGPAAPDDGDVEPDPAFDSIPATFPSDIPLFDGEVLQGIDVGTGWSVLFQANDVVADFNTAADLLEGAGYEAIARSTDGGQGFGNFNNGVYSINLSASDTADYGPAVAYTVVKIG